MKTTAKVGRMYHQVKAWLKYMSSYTTDMTEPIREAYREPSREAYKGREAANYSSWLCWRREQLVRKLYSCTTVHMYNCIYVQLYICTTEIMYICTTVEVYKCSYL